MHRPSSAVASFVKEVNPRLAKRPLVFNGRLANRGLTSLVKDATAGREQFKEHGRRAVKSVFSRIWDAFLSV